MSDIKTEIATLVEELGWQSDFFDAGEPREFALLVAKEISTLIVETQTVSATNSWPCACGGEVKPEVWLRCSNSRCGNPAARPNSIDGER